MGLKALLDLLLRPVYIRAFENVTDFTNVQGIPWRDPTFLS